MGYTPRETTGGGSSESRESVQGNRERIERDRDRNRDRNNSYSQRKAQEEAARKAKEKSDREAREKAEREAREKERREAEEKARKEAEAKAKEEAGGFGGFGNLSDTAMGSGILSRMSLNTPTKAQESMGITSDVQRSLPSGSRISDDDMVKAIESANNSVARDVGYGVAETVANTFAPIAGGAVVNKIKSATEAPSLADQAWADNLTAALSPNMFQANYDNAVKQDKLNDAVKQSMSNGNLVRNISDATGAVTMAGLVNGGKSAAKSASILGNPVVGVLTSVADPVIGHARWANKNADELERLGIDLSSIPTMPRDRDNSSKAQGILANMAQTASSTSQLDQQSELPSFEWASGDDFKFNYGMGFKR